ncbi:MAG: CHAD domain-containing protein [Myxococcota bacterium]|nr:CHAD domain-containing protein [Myxococcota bacterium]
MPYRIQANESVQEALARIAAEQLDRAEAELEDPRLDLHATVHQVRKRCKKVRGLLRLVRPALTDGVYRRENDALRDAARLLSDLRDAEVLRRTVEDLLEEDAAALDRRAFDPVVRLLRERRDAAAGAADADGRMDAFATALHAVRGRCEGWTLEEEGWRALEGGLRKTCRRGRKAMKKAYDDPDPERFHDWRKRAKYGMYHLRLLRDVWRGPLEAWEEAQHLLSDFLGDDHDLAVLDHRIRNEPEVFGPPAVRETLRGLAAARGDLLRERARTLGARLYADTPGTYARRLGACFEAWRAEGG